MIKNEVAKGLNQDITGEKFVNKDTDKFIYASLSQPPIRIINKNNSNDELDFTVECPNCGRHINYGTETFMASGHIYCSKEDCKEEVYKKWNIEK